MYNEDNANYILASYLPDGQAWEAKNETDSNLYKFLDALTKSFILFEQDLEKVYAEMNPATTEDLISRWELEFGMAQSCLGIASTIEERRANLLIKMNLDGIQTVDDFIRLAADLGFTVQVHAGAKLATYPFSVEGYPFILGTQKWVAFTMYVDLPSSLNEEVYPFSANGYPFILLSELGKGVVECMFDKLVPANVNVVYRYIL